MSNVFRTALIKMKDIECQGRCGRRDRGLWLSIFFQIVRYSEILMLPRKTFRLLLLVKTKISNLSENHLTWPPYSTGGTQVFSCISSGFLWIIS